MRRALTLGFIVLVACAASWDNPMAPTSARFFSAFDSTHAAIQRRRLDSVWTQLTRYCGTGGAKQYLCAQRARVDSARQDEVYTPADTTTPVPPPPPPPPPPPSGITVQPGASIQAAVDANPAGSTFLLKAGTYTRQSVVPKDGDVFRGELGTIFDGQGVTAFAFKGYTGSRWVNDVKLVNLAVTRYAPPAQDGIISGGSDLVNATTGWVLDSLDVSYSTNLGVRIGNRMQVLRSNLHHNASINIGGVGRAVLVDGVESAYGNVGCVKDPGFESGGSKFVKTDSLIVRNSFFHHNCGVGLWLDIDNIHALLENNRVEDNGREGICVEISYATVIRNNSVSRNGWPTDPYRANGWAWDAGIGIHASSDVEVYGNTLVENFNGIVGIQQARDPAHGDATTYLLQNAYVHDNTVTLRTPPANGDGGFAGGAVNDLGDLATFTSRNNRWVHNTYAIGGNPAPFAWMNGPRTQPQWVGYGQDVTGVFTP